MRARKVFGRRGQASRSRGLGQECVAKPRNNTRTVIIQIYRAIPAQHRVRLARACLAVCEDRAVVAVEAVTHKRFPDSFENRCLGTEIRIFEDGPQYVIEGERFLVYSPV